MLKIEALDSLSAVVVIGADAQSFMQGQQTGDVKRLSRERAVWGANCTGQGRVQTIITMLVRDEGLVALLPSRQAERTLARLRAVTLSSKVAFEPLPFVVAPVSPTAARGVTADLPATPGDCRTAGPLTLLRWWSADERHLLVAPRTAVSAVDSQGTGQVLAWRRDDLLAGLPQIYAETQTSFVPQMLNLDLLGGLSYEKGCYVGQEVVSRARRAGVPRRMFRFSAACAAPPPATAVVVSGDADAGEVVDAVDSAAGCDLLAVVDFDKRSASLSLRGISGSDLTPEPLPYAVPEGRR